MKIFSISMIFISATLTYGANILGIFYIPTYSHQKPFLNLGKELSLGGHKVTLITTNPMNDQSLTNLTEIDISYIYDITRKHRIDKVLSSQNSLWTIMKERRKLHDVLAEAILKNNEVQALIHEKFDLLITEPHDPIFLAFGPRLKIPIVAISSMGVSIDMHDAIGNPTHPILAPEIFLPHTGLPDATFLENLESLLFNIWYRMLYYWQIIPKMDEIARKYLGDNLPSIAEIQSRISLLLLTNNPILDPVRPNVPIIINIQYLHMDKPKALPEDIQKFMDSSSRGIVYFSLGSNVKSSGLKNHTLKIIIEALGALPYDVIWKYEEDSLPEKPVNVIIRKWLPQQDVLGHPNIKVFITQGGVQSIEEAIAKGVPMVGLPFMGDQPKNVQKLVKWNLAASLDPMKMTSKELKETIVSVARNSSFRKRVLEIKALIEDQPMIGVQKAIWWIEYVLRHNGTEHMRYPGADMPLYKYLMLDIISVSLVVIMMIFYIIVKFSLHLKRTFTKLKSKTE